MKRVILHMESLASSDFQKLVVLWFLCTIFVRYKIQQFAHCGTSKRLQRTTWRALNESDEAIMYRFNYLSFQVVNEVCDTYLEIYFLHDVTVLRQFMKAGGRH